MGLSTPSVCVLKLAFGWFNSYRYYLRQGGYVFAGFCLSVCVCVQDNSKSYGRIFLKFWGYVGHGTNYKWFNFGRDPAGILDSGSLWNFRYHCVKGGTREPLQNRRQWRHLVCFGLLERRCGLRNVSVFAANPWQLTERSNVGWQLYMFCLTYLMIFGLPTCTSP